MNFIKSLNNNKYFYFILFLALGIILYFFPMLKSNFDLIPSDYSSAKFSIYILEHARLYFNHFFVPNIHSEFWTLPNANNIQSNLAEFNSLLGIAPIYYILRLFLKSPFSAFQFLLIILSILNYSTFHYFLNKNFNFSKLANAFSSFIFAFSLMRFYQINDVQFESQFLTILSLIFLLKVGDKNSLMKNHLYFILFSIFAILQFYTSFYLGYFYIFSLFLYFFLAFIPKNSRDMMLNYFRKNYRYLFLYFILIFVSIIPIYCHFYNLDKNIILANDFINNISNFGAFFKNTSLLDNLFIQKINFIMSEKYIISSFSIGLLSSIFAIFGLFKLNKYRGVISLTLISIFVLSISTFAKHFWHIFYYLLFGTEKIEFVSYLAFITLLILSIGIASAINYFKDKKKIILAIILPILFIEQISALVDKHSYWKTYQLKKVEFNNQIETIAKQIPKNVDTFYLNFEELKKDDLTIINPEYKNKIAKKQIDALSLFVSEKIKIKSSFIKEGQKNIYILKVPQNMYKI